MNQNPCGQLESGFLAKFIPHMPLTTTNGSDIVATTDSALVASHSLFETCVRYESIVLLSNSR